jgi:DNA-binding HxlR family transcriptional regulator
MIRYANRTYNCAMELSLDRVGGKWKGLLLWHLAEGTLRFNALRRLFPGLSQKMLAQQLRELEGDGLVARTVFDEMPPRVDYALTEAGRAFVPILKAMNAWGQEHLTPQTPIA